MSTEDKKYDQGKPQLRLFPHELALAMCPGISAREVILQRAWQQREPMVGVLGRVYEELRDAYQVNPLCGWEYGQKKYGVEQSWRDVSNAAPRYFDALLRHLAAYNLGEEIDAESGVRHVDLAATNVIMLMVIISP